MPVYIYRLYWALSMQYTRCEHASRSKNTEARKLQLVIEEVQKLDSSNTQSFSIDVYISFQSWVRLLVQYHWCFCCPYTMQYPQDVLRTFWRGMGPLILGRTSSKSVLIGYTIRPIRSALSIKPFLSHQQHLNGYHTSKCRRGQLSNALYLKNNPSLVFQRKRKARKI